MKIEEIKNGNMNEVYLLTTDEDKYIVRTSDFDNSFECKVLKILEKHSFNCPKIITNFTFWRIIPLNYIPNITKFWI